RHASASGASPAPLPSNPPAEARGPAAATAGASAARPRARAPGLARRPCGCPPEQLPRRASMAAGGLAETGSAVSSLRLKSSGLAHRFVKAAQQAAHHVHEQRAATDMDVAGKGHARNQAKA